MQSMPLTGIRVSEIVVYISAAYAGVALRSLKGQGVKTENLDGEYQSSDRCVNGKNRRWQCRQTCKKLPETNRYWITNREFWLYRKTIKMLCIGSFIDYSGTTTYICGYKAENACGYSQGFRISCVELVDDFICSGY